MTYQEKLRDPRWQKKRLEIFERDEWRCRYCFSKDKTLNLHHKEYIKNREPWEYDDTNFITLCEECHVELQRQIDLIKFTISNFPKMAFICEVIFKDLEVFKNLLKVMYESCKNDFKGNEDDFINMFIQDSPYSFSDFLNKLSEEVKNDN